MIYMKNQCQRKKGVEGRDEGKAVKADQMCTHTERVAKIGRQRESERCGIRQIWNKKLRKTDIHEERKGSGGERDNEMKERSYKGRHADGQIYIW